MSLVDVFFAAAILGAWLIGPVALFAAIGAAIWAGRWVKRIARVARQWKRDTQHQPHRNQPQTPARIDDRPGMNLALADECELIWSASQKEGKS